MYANRQDRLEAAKSRMLAAYQWSQTSCFAAAVILRCDQISPFFYSETVSLV